MGFLSSLVLRKWLMKAVKAKVNWNVRATVLSSSPPFFDLCVGS